MKLIFALAGFIFLVGPATAGCDDAIYGPHQSGDPALPDHEAASTPVAIPVFYQLVRGQDGRAVMVPGESFVDVDQCWTAAGQRPNPLDYYCLRYESVPRIRYVFPD